jgi:hypothetical protein
MDNRRGRIVPYGRRSFNNRTRHATLRALARGTADNLRGAVRRLSNAVDYPVLAVEPKERARSNLRQERMRTPGRSVGELVRSRYVVGVCITDEEAGRLACLAFRPSHSAEARLDAPNPTGRTLVQRRVDKTSGSRSPRRRQLQIGAPARRELVAFVPALNAPKEYSGSCHPYTCLRVGDALANPLLRR